MCIRIIIVERLWIPLKKNTYHFENSGPTSIIIIIVGEGNIITVDRLVTSSNEVLTFCNSSKHYL